MNKCVQCSHILKHTQVKFCSNKCQKDNEYDVYILKWQNGDRDGTRGVSARNLSNHVIRYIRGKYNDQCAKCGWNEVNVKTGVSPLEIDHIDGNADNSAEANLILLCPNCHSLTNTYKNLNNGSGRGWRREKYVKIV